MRPEKFVELLHLDPRVQQDVQECVSALPMPLRTKHPWMFFTPLHSQVSHTIADVSRGKLRRTGNSVGASTLSRRMRVRYSVVFCCVVPVSLPAPDVACLIENRYETWCKTCDYSSISSNSFLQLELRMHDATTLEQCLELYLAEEELSGDNQYQCPQCNAKRDAGRAIRLRSLPPVRTLLS